MESVVDEDSPLASYLEGTGNAPIFSDNEDATPAAAAAAAAAAASAAGQAAADDVNIQGGNATFGMADGPGYSFAPSGASTAYETYRKRIPRALRLHVRSTSTSLSRLHNAFYGMVKGRIGRQENATFLDRFRYTIIASDLLSEHHHGQHGPATTTTTTTTSKSALNVGGSLPGDISSPSFSTTGVIGIATAAFFLAGSIAWARSLSQGAWWVQILTLLALTTAGGGSAYVFVRRKWLQHIRAQVLGSVSSFVANAQAFDAALSTAVTIIQEVELVARGYRISTPLPPVSRLDDQGQQRRCARLRSAARQAVQEVLPNLTRLVGSSEHCAVIADLERYHDIYEITRSDIDEVEQAYFLAGNGSGGGGGDGGVEEEAESLRALKLSMRQLFMARKLLLCNLLAIDADGTASDFSKWGAVVRPLLQELSTGYLAAAGRLDDLLSDQERFTTPATPKLPLTPSREKVRVQIRRLGGLSTGIRGLQAKMHMLREEADHGVDTWEDGGELSQSLISQYEAIGADLKALLQEWEEGRAALNSSHQKRRSLSSAGLLSPRSETPTSLSGSTAFGESPADAFRLLNGETLSPRLDATSSDEEVFEAVAMPRQRSTLTREERIVKMREDREQREKAREGRQESTNMLRELEMVLKYKPQGGNKSSRRVTVM